MLKTIEYSETDPYFRVGITAFKDDGMGKDSVHIEVRCDDGVFRHAWLRPVESFVNKPIDIKSRFSENEYLHFIKLAGGRILLYTHYGDDENSKMYSIPQWCEEALYDFFRWVWEK